MGGENSNIDVNRDAWIPPPTQDSDHNKTANRELWVCACDERRNTEFRKGFRGPQASSPLDLSGGVLL